MINDKFKIVAINYWSLFSQHLLISCLTPLVITWFDFMVIDYTTMSVWAFVDVKYSCTVWKKFKICIISHWTGTNQVNAMVEGYFKSLIYEEFQWYLILQKPSMYLWCRWPNIYPCECRFCVCLRKCNIISMHMCTLAKLKAIITWRHFGDILRYILVETFWIKFIWNLSWGTN